MTWRIIGFNHRDRREFIAAPMICYEDCFGRFFWQCMYIDVIIYTRDEEAFATKVMEVLFVDEEG